MYFSSLLKYSASLTQKELASNVPAGATHTSLSPCITAHHLSINFVHFPPRRIVMGKDLRLTAEMLSIVPKDHQWTLVRCWVNLLLKRLRDHNMDVYDAIEDLGDISYSIERTRYDIEWAQDHHDASSEAEAVRRLYDERARHSNVTKILRQALSKGNDILERFESNYRDLMMSLGHPERNPHASSTDDRFDPSNPFKSFSYEYRF
jgi:hypothetical protein